MGVALSAAVFYLFVAVLGSIDATLKAFDGTSCRMTFELFEHMSPIKQSKC